MQSNPAVSKGRLRSLDLFRGLIMFALVAESTRLYSVLEDLFQPGTFLGAFVQQFHHHPWNGLRFWDLIQPYFMFIVGVAMAFSLAKRWERGHSWQDTFRHILYRCGMLLLFGVGLHCVYSGQLVWELWNVLSQLSVTVLVAFLLFQHRVSTQILVSFGLLILTEILYRFAGIEGFDQPFVQGRNFGTWMDHVLMGKDNGGGWVAINAIPTSAHTIWGVLCGKLLMSEKPDLEKVKLLVLAGLGGLVVGYGLDWTGITPIIKRICTSSFVIVSGGWCLLTLGFFYWLNDVKGIQKGSTFFVIVGTSPIFIYLFSETVGKQWFNDAVGIFTNGVMGWVGIPEPVMLVITSLCVLALEWYLCYWLYKRNIIIKI